MKHNLSIRREDLQNEQRTPICPMHLSSLHKQKIETVVQPSKLRVFTDEEYLQAGAKLQEELNDQTIVLGLKEIVPEKILLQKTYVFFSHTIKGQPQNMLMLKTLMERGCTLIDYEKIIDDQGRRLLFFGYHAGLAGTVDTLWAFGQKLLHEKIETPFARLRLTKNYDSLQQVTAELQSIGEQFKAQSLPAEFSPLTIGVLGDGNVSKGTQKILQWLQAQPISPKELQEIRTKRSGIYYVVFREEHLVESKSGQISFDLQKYYHHPETFQPVFSRYLPALNILINCIYWDKRYPRFVTHEDLRLLFSSPFPRLRVIGDISCDINGAIQATVRSTNVQNPVFVYNPSTQLATDGVTGKGPAVIAIANLPSELPKEASEAFGSALLAWLPGLAATDFTVPFDRCSLPKPLKRATIVYQGALTKEYSYLLEHLP
ncbi:MAG: hypothetical protein V1754_15205 [Pseudomonadota bacterium]